MSYTNQTKQQLALDWHTAKVEHFRTNVQSAIDLMADTKDFTFLIYIFIALALIILSVYLIRLSLRKAFIRYKIISQSYKPTTYTNIESGIVTLVASAATIGLILFTIGDFINS